MTKVFDVVKLLTYHSVSPQPAKLPPTEIARILDKANPPWTQSRGPTLVRTGPRGAARLLNGAAIRACRSVVTLSPLTGKES